MNFYQEAAKVLEALTSPTAVNKEGSGKTLANLVLNNPAIKEKKRMYALLLETRKCMIIHKGYC